MLNGSFDRTKLEDAYVLFGEQKLREVKMSAEE